LKTYLFELSFPSNAHELRPTCKPPFR
jgi:hypothetical protein